MNVSRTDSDIELHDGTCIVCGAHIETESTVERFRLYCSAACSQKAYRRRRAAEKEKEAARLVQDEIAAHKREWIALLTNAGSLSRKQAERVFVALTSIGRLRGLPYEQERLF